MDKRSGTDGRGYASCGVLPFKGRKSMHQRRPYRRAPQVQCNWLQLEHCLLTKNAAEAVQEDEALMRPRARSSLICLASSSRSLGPRGYGVAGGGRDSPVVLISNSMPCMGLGGDLV